MKTLSEMKTLVENGKTHLLTIEKAKELKGKTISTIYFGYSGQDGVDNFVVGEVMSELEYYRNLKEDCFPDKYGFKNRAEYWESYMNKEKLEEKKNTTYYSQQTDATHISVKLEKEFFGAQMKTDG